MSGAARRSSTSEPMGCKRSLLHALWHSRYALNAGILSPKSSFATGIASSLASLCTQPLCLPGVASDGVRGLIQHFIGGTQHRQAADQGWDNSTQAASGCVPCPPAAEASGHGRSLQGLCSTEQLKMSSNLQAIRLGTTTAERQRSTQRQRRARPAACYPLLVAAGCDVPLASAHGHTLARRGLHGLASVMTAAESARDLLSAIAQPASYAALAEQLALRQPHSTELFEALGGLVHSRVEELGGESSPACHACMCAHGHVALAASRIHRPCMFQHHADTMHSTPQSKPCAGTCDPLLHNTQLGSLRLESFTWRACDGQL
jgi:hypothetical protein